MNKIVTQNPLNLDEGKSVINHSCHKLQINRKYCLHPFEAKQVEILYLSSHIKEGFYIERENFE